MAVYWTIFIWSFVVSSYLNLTKKNLIDKDVINSRKYSFISVFISLFALWFFACYRTSGVGDTILYIENYLKTPTEFVIPEYSSSFLFDMLRRFCKAFISQDPTFWLILLATLAIIPICKAFSMYSVDLQISVSFFILSGCFEYFFNGSRQLISICICFYATCYLQKNKIWKYIFFVAIAGLIHGSAFVMLAGIFLYKIKPWSKPIGLICLATIALVCLPSSFLTSLISDAVEGTDYSVYSNQLTGNALNPVRMLSLAVPSVLSFIYRQKIESINDPILNYSVNMGLITSLLYFAGLFINGLLAARMAAYFMIFDAILYPYLFVKVFPKEEKSVRYLFIVAYLIFFAYQMHYVYGGLRYISSILGIRY